MDWIWASRGRDIFSGGADYSADQDDDAARDVFLTRSTPLSLSLLHLPARLTTPKTMTKILLTGATGYIGGTILSTLLRDNHEGVSYGVLIRNAKASDAYEARSITPHLFQGLDDLETIERVAAEYDGAFVRKFSFGESPRVSESSPPRPGSATKGEWRRDVHHPCQQFSDDSEFFRTPALTALYRADFGHFHPW